MSTLSDDKSPADKAFEHLYEYSVNRSPTSEIESVLKNLGQKRGDRATVAKRARLDSATEKRLRRAFSKGRSLVLSMVFVIASLSSIGVVSAIFLPFPHNITFPAAASAIIFFQLRSINKTRKKWLN